ncbi:hypothetical protein [Streptosporangium sp. NBC_01756]|uniref:hypothetical protein n=1 Tax=Streptosporangium sp. NBC_01756 TaxID=2975950 RepID=UPI002DDA12A7|nr:hypothetical protein [Streptosporangium sp. NBC_01756]WSC89390.1 hypothetical protein OIE48_14750 [Streptosporangium sp. NBC_01756]
MRLLTSLLVAAVLPMSPALPGWTAGSADCSTASGNDFDGDGTDDVAVGDPSADLAGAGGAGAVHVLSGRGTGGTVVSAPEPGAGDGFGWSVRLTHLDADRCADLLIGAPYADVAGERDAGAVYAVYGGAQRRTVRVVAPRPEPDAHFGWSLAAGGTLVAVGAPYEDADGVADAGSVYLFQAGGLGGARRISQDSEGVSGNSETGDMFGWSVAIGRLGGAAGEADLAVGAPYENDDGAGRQDGAGKTDSGSIAVLFDVRSSQGRYTGRKWDLHEIVDTDAGDRFGYAMAYAQEGDVGYLAVSAPLGDGGRVKDSGLVALFQASGTAEITLARTFDQGTEGAPGEGYGFSLALTAEGGVRLAVGVPFDGPDQRGGVQVIPLGNPGQAGPVAWGRAGDHVGWAVGFSGNRLVAGAPDQGASGAVTLLGRNDATGIRLAPGAGQVPAVDGGGPADFGAAVG